jgi:O-antigen/teichoic acid export membrane protein
MLGSIAHTISQWLHFAILARWGGLGAVGTYAFALALTAPVMGFAALQLPALVATDVQGRYAFRHYAALTMLTSAGGVLVIAFLPQNVGDARFGWSVLAPVCVMRIADLLADLYYGLWQRYELMRVIAVSRFVRSGGSVALLWAAVTLGTGVPGAAAGAALGSVAALVFVHDRTWRGSDLQRLERKGDPLSYRRLGRLAAEAFPLGVIVLLGALQANVPRYFIEVHEGREALGLFAAANQITSAGTLIIAALGSAAVPRLASWYASRDVVSFQSLLRKLVLAGAGLGIVAVALSAAVGREVLALAYSPEFAVGAHLLVVLSVAAGAGFVAALIGYALTAARIIAVQPLILAVTLALLVGCCAVLVPRHGAAGAAWSLVAASALHGVASWIAVHRMRGRVVSSAIVE